MHCLQGVVNTLCIRVIFGSIADENLCLERRHDDKDTSRRHSRKKQRNSSFAQLTITRFLT
jgi:hypothetical protein